MERVGRAVLISEPEGFSAKAIEHLRRAGFHPVLNEGGLSGIAGLLPDKEGLIVAAVLFSMPFVILYVFHRVIPLFPGAVRRGTA